MSVLSAAAQSLGVLEALLLWCGRPAAESLPLGGALPAEAEIHLGVFMAVSSWGQQWLASL